MKISTLQYLALILLLIIHPGCSKTDFLNAKPDQSLILPKTLDDYQKLVDNDGSFNGYPNAGIVPSLLEIGTDDVYIPDASYTNKLTQVQQNCYTWATHPYPSTTVTDWNQPYSAIFYANEILSGIEKLPLTAENVEQHKNIKGCALFHRAHMFYQLAQAFAPSFIPSTAGTDPGIPIRLSSDINEKLQRASLSQTYDQVINDLKEAASLLPKTQDYKTRPSLPAAYALLARTYLTMSSYDSALVYADKTLSLNSRLLDYNTLDSTTLFPFERFNEEVLFSCLMIRNTAIMLGNGTVDTSLLASYVEGDLRKSLFFIMYPGLGLIYRGAYDGNLNNFNGLATDELFMIKAECLARKGETNASMQVLNALLVTRWKTGTFTPFAATNATEALALILAERRKELLYRGLRWTDLRRLNVDNQHKQTLTRIVNGQAYTLPPNDNRYTYLIPDNVISFNPDMPQNKR